jgi:hypothetical protein
VDEDTSRSALLEDGWFWTGLGLALTSPSGNPPIVRVDAPPGTYGVEAATTPIARAPWFSGIRRWRRRAFGQETPSEMVPLGPHDGSSGTVRVTLPDTLSGHHVLGIRLIRPARRPRPRRRSIRSNKSDSAL